MADILNPLDRFKVRLAHEPTPAQLLESGVNFGDWFIATTGRLISRSFTLEEDVMFIPTAMNMIRNMTTHLYGDRLGMRSRDWSGEPRSVRLVAVSINDRWLNQTVAGGNSYTWSAEAIERRILRQETEDGDAVAEVLDMPF